MKDCLELTEGSQPVLSSHPSNVAHSVGALHPHLRNPGGPSHQQDAEAGSP